jgi:hypothetical protein
MMRCRSVILAYCWNIDDGAIYYNVVNVLLGDHSIVDNDAIPFNFFCVLLVIDVNVV